MIMGKRCVKALVDEIYALEKAITKTAINSASNDAYEVAELLLETIKQKNELIGKLKAIKKFMSKLPEQEQKIFDLYFIKGAEVSKWDCKISLRQRFRIIARLKKELEEKLL